MNTEECDGNTTAESWADTMCNVSDALLLSQLLSLNPRLIICRMGVTIGTKIYRAKISSVKAKSGQVSFCHLSLAKSIKEV